MNRYRFVLSAALAAYVLMLSLPSQADPADPPDLEEPEIVVIGPGTT